MSLNFAMTWRVEELRWAEKFPYFILQIELGSASRTATINGYYPAAHALKTLISGKNGLEYVFLTSLSADGEVQECLKYSDL